MFEAEVTIWKVNRQTTREYRLKDIAGNSILLKLGNAFTDLLNSSNNHFTLYLRYIT